MNTITLMRVLFFSLIILISSCSISRIADVKVKEYNVYIKEKYKEKGIPFLCEFVVERKADYNKFNDLTGKDIKRIKKKAVSCGCSVVYVMGNLSEHGYPNHFISVCDSTDIFE